VPDFGFSEEEERYRTEVREFAERELSPLRRRWDREREYALEQMRKLLQSGLPQRARQIGPTDVLRGIFAEEVARADFNCVYPLLPLRAGPGGSMEGLGLPLQMAEEVARGEKLQALAITEAETGSDAGHIQTTAVRDGDDWVLNGEKNSVSFPACAIRATVSIALSLLSPATQEVVAEARVILAGDVAAKAEVEVRDASGELVAIGMVVCTAALD
jgi:alkylation response protein AidB-like acyl-CoA dehydrogenase